MRAVVYARVSTSMQAEKGASLAVQVQECTRKANDLGADVVKVIRDEGVSGALLLARPGIREALRMIEAGEADALICSDLSRFTRDLEHQQQLLRSIRKNGAKLILCGMTIEDSPEGDFALDVLGAANKMQRRQMSEKVKKSRKEFAQQGRQTFARFSPWGYKIPTKADVMQHKYTQDQLGLYLVVEEEAQTVREVFRRYAAGCSLNKLADWLNDTGVPTRTRAMADSGTKVPKIATRWSRVALRAIIMNPVYKGTAVFGRRAAEFDEEGTAKRAERLLEAGKENDGRRVYKLRSRAEGSADTVEIPVPAIVDVTTWGQCQRRLKENQSRLGGSPERRTLLSGLVVCPECGYRMHARPTRSGRYFGCNNNPACGYKTQTRTDRVEQTVLRAIAELSATPDRLQAAVDAFHAQHDGERLNRLPTLLKEMEALAARERATAMAQISAVGRGGDEAIYLEEIDRIVKRRRELREEITLLEQTAKETVFDSPGARTLFTRAVNKAQTVLKDEDVTIGEKNDLLRLLFRSIHIEPSGRLRLQLGEASGVRLTVKQPNCCLTVERDGAGIQIAA